MKGGGGASRESVLAWKQTLKREGGDAIKRRQCPTDVRERNTRILKKR